MDIFSCVGIWHMQQLSKMDKCHSALNYLYCPIPHYSVIRNNPVSSQSTWPLNRIFILENSGSMKFILNASALSSANLNILFFHKKYYRLTPVCGFHWYTHSLPKMGISRVTKCHLHNKCYSHIQFQEYLINNLDRINNVFITHATCGIKLFINVWECFCHSCYKW